MMEYTNSIFEESWWLDAVAKDSWKELKVERDGNLIARWPIVYKNNSISLPRYTQTMGIYCNPEYVKSLNDVEEVYLDLINQLPPAKKISVGLDPKNTFYLPFVWNDFKVSPSASYIIDDLSDLDLVFSRMPKNTQRDIKQASKKVTVSETTDIEKLIELSFATYKRQHRAYIVQPDMIRNIYNACMEHNACKLLQATDAEGNVHSMVLYVYDSRRCYYLIAASNPELNGKSCANTLLVWEGIKFAATVSEVFDFEGSTIKGISTFFRRFGSKFTYHFVITRNSLSNDVFSVLKPRIKKMLGHKK